MFLSSARGRRSALLLLLLAALFVFGHADRAAAQTGATELTQGSEPAADGSGEVTVNVDQLDELVSTLENENERAVFLDNLKALIAAEKGLGDTGEQETEDPTLDILDDLSDGLQTLDRSLGELVADLERGGGLGEWFHQQVSDPDRVDAWLDALWQLAVIAIAGAVLWWLLRLALAAQVRRLEALGTSPWLERLGSTLLRSLLSLVPVAGFAGGAYAALTVLPGGEVVSAIATPVILGVVAAQALLVVARAIFAPVSDQLRLFPMNDGQAAYLYVWTVRFVAVAIYGTVLAVALLKLGVPENAYGLWIRLLGLVLVMMVFVFLLQVRQPVAQWIREHPRTGGAQMLRNRIADIWHILAMLLVVAVFVVWALEVEGGFGFLVSGSVISVVTLFVALILSTGLGTGLERLFSLRQDLRARFPGLERRVNRYVSLLHWFLNVVVWVAAVVIILEAWRIDALSILMSAEGRALIGHVVAVLFVVLVAVVVWEMADGFITSRIAPGHAGSTNARLRTLLPLLRNVLLVTICTIATITILSELGVDIGPLLAGAGVIGLAIGFGAQALVRDVITGAFILFEDQIQVGDYVEAGGKMGTVESLSIRTLRMRDLDGYVHVVPFGEVAAVTNMTRDFGYAMIDVGVAYQENTDEVLEVIREVDREARQDEALAERMIGELEVFGVHSLDASSVTLRMRIKTLAGYQWGVRREYFRRIKLKFDEVGIEIPFPHMTVYFGEVRGGHTPPAHLRLDAGDMKQVEVEAATAGEAAGDESAGEGEKAPS